MLVSVYFTKIRHQIISRIHQARDEIRVAVAWLTDEDIIRELTHKCRAGVKVKIAISHCVDNFIDLRHLRLFLLAGGELFVTTPVFLHHKFCIIDDRIIINGSYNWTYSARQHEENITVMVQDLETREEKLVFDGFKAKHNYLCNRCSVPVTDVATLKQFGDSGRNLALIISVTDVNEIQLRNQFKRRIEESFAKTQALKIPVGNALLERMERDGGGVDFVKRILRDEMNSGDMKSGFKQLEAQIPHRVNLSLEFLVAQLEFASLFTSEEIKFCRNLMAKYNL